MALTQITKDQIKRSSSEDYIDVRNNTGSTIAANTFVKVTGDYSAGTIPTVTAITSTSDSPIAFLTTSLADSTNTSSPSSTSKAINRGRVQISGFNTTGSTVGNPVYFTSSGTVTLTSGSVQIGTVLTLSTNGVIYLDLTYFTNKGIPVYASPPSNPINGQVYFDSGFNVIMAYDSTRAKWLSTTILTLEFDRSGTSAAGTSLRTGSGIPTSTTPVQLERNMCLVGINGSTSALEQFQLRIDDVSGGSGTQTAVNYQNPGPTTTQNYLDLTLNANYNANDRIDVYVNTTASGNISDPRMKLYFKYRK